jgi:protein-S-isoprenylcysteine O-methyltransferase Ste14
LASTITAYLLVFVYLITDARLRSGKKAGSLVVTETDRQSTLRLVQAFGYRIRSEEAMLIARFGQEYEEYRRRTKRLIPYLY